MSVQIPISNDPNQSFKVKIPLGSRNINLGFFLTFNAQAGYWVLTLSNADDDTVLLAGVPMVCGLGDMTDLLTQYKHLGIGSAYLIKVSPSDNDSPGADDWGSSFVLLWDE